MDENIKKLENLVALPVLFITDGHVTLWTKSLAGLITIIQHVIVILQEYRSPSE